MGDFLSHLFIATPLEFIFCVYIYLLLFFYNFLFITSSVFFHIKFIMSLQKTSLLPFLLSFSIYLLPIFFRTFQHTINSSPLDSICSIIFEIFPLIQIPHVFLLFPLPIEISLSPPNISNILLKCFYFV